MSNICYASGCQKQCLWTQLAVAILCLELTIASSCSGCGPRLLTRLTMEEQLAPRVTAWTRHVKQTAQVSISVQRKHTCTGDALHVVAVFPTAESAAVTDSFA